MCITIIQLGMVQYSKSNIFKTKYQRLYDLKISPIESSQPREHSLKYLNRKSEREISTWDFAFSIENRKLIRSMS